MTEEEALALAKMRSRLANANKARGNRTREGIGDVMRSGASGIAQGATGILDFPANIPGYLAQGAAYLGEKAGLVEPETRARFNETISGFREGSGATGVAERAAPEIMGYQPTTTAGEYAQSAGQFLPGMAFGGTPTQMIAGGLGAEAGGQATEGTRYETPARIVGGLAGASAPNALKRAATPNPADPALTESSRRLAREGVPLTAGQRTGNINLQYQEQMTPRTVQMIADQADDFTSAVLRRIGVTAKRAEPEVLDEAYRRIGGAFDDLASRNTIAPDRRLVTRANNVLRNYEQSTNKNNIAPIVNNVVDKIRDKLRRKEPITGREYQQFRSDLGPLATSNDKQLAVASRELRLALDDAMERSIRATGNPDDIASYAQARQQYRDYLAIEGAASKPGQNTAFGVISPARLRSEVVRVQGKRNYATGKSDLGGLARDGTRAMPPLPQSGTQPRVAANTIQALSGSGTGVGAGGLAYLLTKDPNIAAAAGVAGAMAPMARNAATGSSLGQSYLANQLFPTQQNALRLLEAGMIPALANAEDR